MFAALFVVASAAVSAQEIIKSSQISAFKSVDFAGKMNVKLIKGDSAKIEIKLNNSLIERLKWGVEEGRLFARLKPTVGANSSADVTLYYVDINSITASEATISTDGVLKGVMLDINASSSASVVGDLDMTDVEVKASGNAAVKLTGGCKYLTVAASSKAKVDSKEFDATSADVSSSSGSEVYVMASERIKINATMGGAVYYKGEPLIVRFVSKTMGTINNIGK